MDESISLNKFISDTGYCSRREADNLITSGRVLLNDHVAELGNRYKPGDTVEVDGSYITAAKKEKRIYLALNKPPGITTTTELHIKDNIISFVGHPKRIFPIGRLDKDSEGLIFLTNDGDIINKILRAGNNHEKEYVVRVNKPVTPAFVQQMSQGVPILDTRTLPCKVQMMGRQTFRITLTQGLNRQIRRMCEYLDYQVTGLQRVRIMNIKLDKLALGKWRYLSDAEVGMLMESVADSSKVNTEKRSAKRRKSEAPAGSPSNTIPGGKDKKTSFSKDRSGTATKGFSAKTGHTAVKSAKTAFDQKAGKTTGKVKGKEKAFREGDKPYKQGGKPLKPGEKNNKAEKPHDKPTSHYKEARNDKPTHKDKGARHEKPHTGGKKGEEGKAKRTGTEGSYKSFRNKGRNKR